MCRCLDVSIDSSHLLRAIKNKNYLPTGEAELFQGLEYSFLSFARAKCPCDAVEKKNKRQQDEVHHAIPNTDLFHFIYLIIVVTKLW